MTTIDGNLKITSITIHLSCKCDITSGGHANIIVSYKVGGGDWSSEKTISSQFGPNWKSLTWDGLSETGLDELQIRLKADIYATGAGGFVSVDVMYAEISFHSHSINICHNFILTLVFNNILN